MATIVIGTFGSYGDVNPYIGLGIGLRRRGHRPVLAMPGIYRDDVRAEGLDFHPVRPDLDIHDRDLARRVMDRTHGTRFLYDNVLIPGLEASYQDLADVAATADLMVTHPAAPAGPIVAERLGLPWVSTVLAPISFFSVHEPMVPAPAPWLYSLTSRSTLLARLFVRHAEWITRRWAKPIRRFRQSLGLPPGRNPIMAGQHSPHLVLALFSRVLAKPRPDWPENVRITGPIPYNGRQDEALPPELEAFLDAGEPPVVFTLGTSAVAVAGSFYDESARAIRASGHRAVLLVGAHSENRPPLSRDMIAVEFAPHAALFPRAAAVVHQGGAGTLHQALRAGRPMIVVPHSHDQPDNARRVQDLGVSRTIYPRKYEAGRVERELVRLLDDPRVREDAAGVGEAVRAEDGVESACDAIESLL